jgi:hypothetical protein
MATVAWKRDAVTAIDAGLKWVEDGCPVLEGADHVDVDGHMYKRYGEAVLYCLTQGPQWRIGLLSGRHKNKKIATRDFTDRQKEFYDSMLPIHMAFGPPDF